MRNSELFKLAAVILIFTLFASCKTSSVSKSEGKAKNLTILEDLRSQDDYFIDIEVIYPLNSVTTTQVANTLLANTGNNANRIDVRGDGNFIELKNDSVKAYLPFFGESRISGGGFGGQNIAIEIDEPLKDLKKNINTKKDKLELEFKATQNKGDKDKYQIKIELFANKKASVDITPVYRTFIRYDGVLTEKKE
jgi:hypothetical protein